MPGSLKCIDHIKTFISPSLRFEIRQAKGRISHFLARLYFWQWQSIKFAFSSTNPTIIHYKGRPENKPILLGLLGVDPHLSGHASVNVSEKAAEVLVTEYPLRDAICIPYCLITIVKLGRPIEDIVASYSKRLRRSIHSDRPNYRYQAIDEPAAVDEIEQSMLKPYATARHDTGAAQLQPGLVRKFAQQQHGRLDLMMQGDEQVGCHLGNPYTRQGKRYWHVNRLGYPSTVFSDHKRWGEVNSINLHLALEAAIINGYDYCDYGVSLAKPGHGLVEWKRRRRGFLATHDNFSYFYMRLPKTGAAQFLWDCPVFGVEAGKPTLHLGIPEGKTDEEMLARYNEMSYDGLYKVYLDCVTLPSAQFVESIRAMYADQDSQPLIISYIVG